MPIRRTRLFIDYATIASILVLVVMVGTLTSSIRHIWDSWRWVIHTREVLEHVQMTISFVHEADFLQKSVLLEENAEDRAALDRTLNAIPQAVQKLQGLTRDNPRQQDALQAYRQTLDRHTLALQAALADPADAGQQTLEERHAAAATRTTILKQAAGLRAEEERLLGFREMQLRNDQIRVIIAVSVVAALSIALLVLVRWLAWRDAVILIDERARLDATLRSIGEAVVAVDLDGRVRFMNPVAEKFLGMSEADAAGRLFEDVFRVGQNAAADGQVGSIYRLVISTGTPRFNVELHAPSAGGPDAEHDWIAGCYPVLIDDRPRGAVISAMDITRLKDAQRKLNEANQTLEQRVLERTEALAETNLELHAFAHTVAHDLRAPLRNIQGFASALLEDETPRLSPTGRMFLQRIDGGVGRLDRLISDLLDYSKLTRGDLPQGPVDLERAVQLALADLEAQIGASGARIEVASPLPAVLGNEALLVQVFNNLIGNAIKFVAPGVAPRVLVRAHAAEDRIRVEVADNGIGISPADRDRVFGVFERLHGQERYPGTGIGLAIVHKAVDWMGGSVRMEEAPGGGAMAVLSLRPPPEKQGTPHEA
ncbi:sensor histidine kinase [Herbaspirillum sp. SJZ107]|uniref:sensor histidine kinase n=1 Tax=Herbaspirillum sp. SJZ107 TaxID=2572881 RepID=UPI001151ACAD|nr:sensor histidine kinase [Herbaspirillum sp. SJZ107]TQK10164.1 PAS domain S-box-containing protein [Herbaspirillum sp. SJZ107]